MATIQPNAIPAGARSRVQASTMLLREYAAMMWPGVPQFYEYRLGPTPLGVPNYPMSPKVVAMLRRANMYADLIVIEPSRLTVIEAAVVGNPAKVSQLRAYASLVQNTPDLAPYLSRQLVEMHLWAVDHSLAHQMAVAHGQAVTIFTPPWIVEYLENKYYRRSSPLEPAPIAAPTASEGAAAPVVLPPES